MGGTYLDLKAPVFDLVALPGSCPLKSCQEAFVAVAGGGTTKAGMQNGIHIIALERLDACYALAEAKFCDTGNDFCTAVDVTADGHYIVAASQTSLLVFAITSDNVIAIGRYTPELEAIEADSSGKTPKNEISCISVNAPKTHIACGDHKGNVYLLRCYFRRETVKFITVSKLQLHQEEITFLAFDRASNIIGSGSADGRATIWNPVTGIFHKLPSIAGEQVKSAAPPKRPGRRQRILRPGSCSYRSIAFSSSCVYCLESTQFGAAVVSTWIPVEEHKVRQYGYISSRFEDESVIVDRGNIDDIIWVAKTWKVLPGGPATSMALDSSRKTLAVGKADGTVIVLDTFSLNVLSYTDEIHSFHISNLAFNSDNTMIVTASPDSQLCLSEKSSFRNKCRMACGKNCCITLLQCCKRFWSFITILGVLLWLLLSLAMVTGILDTQSYMTLSEQLYTGMTKSLSVLINQLHV